MNHIDLFSGIGGFALACQWAGIQTEVFCEKDPFCQKVLKRHWPDVPIIEDVRDFDGTKWTGATLLTGGFPCQPFSVAGKRRGKADDRYLWPEMLRIISEARPTWIIGENVAGIIRMDVEQMLSDLEGIQYQVQPIVIPACAVNAPHRRDRIWIIANSKCSEFDFNVGKFSTENEREISSKCNHLRDTENRKEDWFKFKLVFGRVAPEKWIYGNELYARPLLLRDGNGFPGWVDRLRALGNAIVPQVAYQIIRVIVEAAQ